MMQERALDIFEVWRKEVDADLSDALAQLAEAETALLDAEGAARAGKLERRALAETFAKLHPSTVTANAIAGRKLQRENELDQLNGDVSRRRLELENVRRRVADLRAATEQLDAIAPAEAAKPVKRDAAEPAEAVEHEATT